MPTLSRTAALAALGTTLAATAALIGCGGLGTGNTTVAIRIVDALPSANPVDITVSGAGFVSKVSFRDVTTYGYINQGSNDFTAFQTGTSTPVVPQETLTVTSPVSTVLVVGLNGSTAQPPMFVALPDNNNLPPAGMIKVRVINASPDAGPLDFQAGSTSLGTGIGYAQQGSYLTIPSGTYNLAASKTGATAPVTSRSSVQFAAGHVFTIIVVGQLADGTASIVAQSDV